MLRVSRHKITTCTYYVVNIGRLIQGINNKKDEKDNEKDEKDIEKDETEGRNIIVLFSRHSQLRSKAEANFYISNCNSLEKGITS